MHEEKRKRLYAVLWIDDYGFLKLPRRALEWYHQNAGPISLAVQDDDQYPSSFDQMLKPGSRDSSFDYLSHHYHAIRWQGAFLPKKIYDSLKLYRLVWPIVRLLALSRGVLLKGRFKAGLTAVFGAVLGAIIYLYFVNAILFSVLFILYLLLIGLVGICYYVNEPRNWEYPISDVERNKREIRKAKEEFERRGFEFPKVIRHGWNLPWKGSMEFYVKEMGVLADASAVTLGPDQHPRVGEREITWTIAQPYYASLKGDYNVAWDGTGEDRGILELPVNLGDIAFYGFGEKEEQAIKEIPDGGLVSAYMHPWDNFSVIKEWVTYLKENYDVKFVSAEEALRIYMNVQT